MFGLQPPLDLQTEVFLNVLRQSLVNLSVTGHGLLLAGLRVQVNVVPGTVAVQNATSLRYLTNELATLHTGISLT